MNTIKEYIATTFEREILLTFLDQFDQIIFNSNKDPHHFIEQNLEDKYQSIVLIYLSEGVGAPNDLYERSKIMRKELIEMNTIVITVPLSLTLDQQFTIAKKAREISQSPILVDFLVDHTIIGGAIIEGNGRVGEYSFRRFFEQNKKMGGIQNGL